MEGMAIFAVVSGVAAAASALGQQRINERREPLHERQRSQMYRDKKRAEAEAEAASEQAAEDKAAKRREVDTTRKRAQRARALRVYRDANNKSARIDVVYDWIACDLSALYERDVVRDVVQGLSFELDPDFMDYDFGSSSARRRVKKVGPDAKTATIFQARKKWRRMFQGIAAAPMPTTTCVITETKKKVQRKAHQSVLRAKNEQDQTASPHLAYRKMKPRPSCWAVVSSVHITGRFANSKHQA